jgi:hypothetical protein
VLDRIEVGLFSVIREKQADSVIRHVVATHLNRKGDFNQQRRTAGSKVGQVKTSARQVIFRLADVHPEALQVESMKLLIGGDGRENLLFY